MHSGDAQKDQSLILNFKVASSELYIATILPYLAIIFVYFSWSENTIMLLYPQRKKRAVKISLTSMPVCVCLWHSFQMVGTISMRFYSFESRFSCSDS